MTKLLSDQVLKTANKTEDRIAPAKSTACAIYARVSTTDQIVNSSYTMAACPSQRETRGGLRS
jgi:hypothetical protein